MTKTFNLVTVRAKMTNVILKLDVKNEVARTHDFRVHYSPTDLPVVLASVDTAIEAMATGSSLARALYDNFQADVLLALENAFRLPITYWADGPLYGQPNRPATGRPN